MKSMPSDLNGNPPPVDAVLATVWEHSPCAIMVTDPTGRIERVNPAFLALNGYREEELVGRQPALLRAEGLGESVYQELWQTILVGVPWTGRLHNKRKDGSMYWAVVTIRPILGSSGAIERFISIAENITAEVEASEEARGSRMENHLLALQSGTVFWRVDAKGTYTAVGATAEKVWGYRPDELVNRLHFYDLFPESQRDAVAKAAFETFAAGKPFTQFLNPILRPDGKEIWVETNAVPLFNEDGSLAGYVGTDKDVTELKSAQIELANTVALLQTVMDSTPDLIFAKNLEGRTLICNKACAAIIGKSPGEMIGRTDAENGWPEDCVAKYAEEDRLVLAGETVHVPQDRAERNGELLWFDTIKVPMRSATGEIMGILGVSREVTGIRRAEEERNKSDLVIRQAQQIANLGWWEHHHHSDLVIMSPEACEIFGMEENGGTFSWHVLLESVHPDDRREVEQRYLESIRERQSSFEWEYRLADRSGGLACHVRLRCQHRFDEAGEMVSTLGVVMDVTSRQMLEQQFRQMQKMESIGRLAGGVAHDFNNMLGVILGHSELLLDVVPAAGRMHESLREIQYAANRSAALTRQLLAFARCQPVKPVVVDLNDAIESMVRMLRRLIGEDIDLYWSPCPKACPVFIDPSQIDQILANLCVNARDAIGPRNGSLEIHTTLVSLGRDEAGSGGGLPAGDYVVLSLRDDGCGMDEKTLERMFEPFFTTKSAGVGTGLGLSTVFGIVKQNHGAIHATSQPGMGSTFVIHLPMCASSILPQAAGPAGPPVGGHETVLLVEDDVSVLSLAAAVMGALGYKVIAAASPAEALRLFVSDPTGIDVVVTDVIMPGKNGRELAEELLEIRPGLPMLYVSGHASGVIASQGVGVSGADCLQKPFSVAEMAAGLRSVIDRHAASLGEVNLSA